MRVYVDTSVIVSFVDELDSNHGRATELLESVERDGRVASRLTLAELAPAYSRAGLPDQAALVLFSLGRVSASVVM